MLPNIDDATKLYHPPQGKKLLKEEIIAEVIFATCEQKVQPHSLKYSCIKLT